MIIIPLLLERQYHSLTPAVCADISKQKMTLTLKGTQLTGFAQKQILTHSHTLSTTTNTANALQRSETVPNKVT